MEETIGLSKKTPYQTKHNRFVQGAKGPEGQGILHCALEGITWEEATKRWKEGKDVAYEAEYVSPGYGPGLGLRVDRRGNPSSNNREGLVFILKSLDSLVYDQSLYVMDVDFSMYETWPTVYYAQFYAVYDAMLYVRIK